MTKPPFAPAPPDPGIRPGGIRDRAMRAVLARGPRFEDPARTAASQAYWTWVRACSARALNDAEKATVLYLSLPDDATIGNSYDVKINGEARRVLWLDANTLLIGPDDSDDVRTILSHHRGGGLFTFFCTARGADGYDVHAAPEDGLTGWHEIWSEESGKRADTVSIVGVVTTIISEEL